MNEDLSWDGISKKTPEMTTSIGGVRRKEFAEFRYMVLNGVDAIALRTCSLAWLGGESARTGPRTKSQEPLETWRPCTRDIETAKAS
jgi:hypothetical protein